MFNYNNNLTDIDDYDLETELINKKKKGFLERNKEQEGWLDEDYEGQLSVDVYETEKDIVLKSTIAGINPDDIDINVNNDMITIRGTRSEKREVEEENYLFKECYWGGFSRSIILPQPVKADKIKAELENGILTIRLPKAPHVEKVNIKVKRSIKPKKEKVSNIKTKKTKE